MNVQLWFCGEVVTTCLLDRSVKMFPWMRFVNLYSISEAHDVAGSDLSEYYQSQVRQTWTQSMKLVPLPKSQIDQPGNCICINNSHSCFSYLISTQNNSIYTRSIYLKKIWLCCHIFLVIVHSITKPVLLMLTISVWHTVNLSHCQLVLFANKVFFKYFIWQSKSFLKAKTKEREKRMAKKLY